MSTFTTIAARRPGPPARNGVPPSRPYTYGAPRPAWMAAALARAEAEHGPPVPACVCGTPLAFRRGAYAACPACGHRSYGGGCDDTG